MSGIREVSEKVVVAAEALAVWKKICEPCSILEWNPSIAECRSYTAKSGQIARDYVLQPGGPDAPDMVETELVRSEKLMMITYMVESEDLAFDEYVAQILVTPRTGGGCEVEIRSRFYQTQDDAEALVRGFYRHGLETLGDMMAA